MFGHWESYFKDKLIVPEDIERKVKALKEQKKTIATLNGSFDLLHAGHLHIIYQASLQADILIVALNSDSSVRQYKSPLRPIVPLEYRLKLMAALGFVDYISWFEETDPQNILSLIRPDVHVNGAEYGKNCIESELVESFGGRMHIVELIPSLSTTSLMKKIKEI